LTNIPKRPPGIDRAQSALAERPGVWRSVSAGIVVVPPVHEKTVAQPVRERFAVLPLFPWNKTGAQGLGFLARREPP
jgi:hypothetical protein